MPKEKMIGIALMILSAIGFVAISAMSATITMSQHQRVINGITIDELSWKGKNPQYDCDITIPQIQGYATADVAGLNAELLAIAKKFVEETIPENIKERAELLATAKKLAEKDIPSASYEYYVGYQVSSGMDNILDITLATYMFTGGAHGMTFETIYHLDTLSGKELGFDDIFKSGAKEYFEGKILAQMAQEPDNYFDDAKPDVRAANFYFDKGDVIFVFGLYEIAPYVSGMPEFRFNKDDIKQWLKKL